jgi:membrane dipeptidase
MNDHAISRRTVLRTLASVGAATFAAPAVLRGRYRLFAASPAEYSARAIKLVGNTVVVDMLNQFRFADLAEKPPLSERWLTVPQSFTAADWRQYRDSGIRVFALGAGRNSYEAAVKWAADWNGFIASYSDWFMRVDSADDFATLKKNGKIGILLNTQNANHFRTPDDVTVFWGLGQRASQLTYNSTNRLGSGFLADADAGLSEFGAQILAKMQQVGMAVDLAHSADKTTLDALSAATKPLIVSHSGARAVTPGHLRAKTDEMIQKLAKLGGVMGIPMIRFMIKLDEPVTVEHVADHFDHVAKLVGPEHVGIGGDLDLVGNANPINSALGDKAQQLPSNQPNFDRYQFHTAADGKPAVTGLDHPKRVYDLTEALIRRKHSDATIALMLGGNWQRVLGTIWNI